MNVDHHEVLGVSPWANQKEVKRAFRRLVKDHHPDRLPDGQDREESERKLKQIIESYKILSTEQPEAISRRPRKRKKFAIDHYFKNKYLVAFISFFKNTCQSFIVPLVKNKYIIVIRSELRYILPSRKRQKLWRRVGAPAIILGALLMYGTLGIFALFVLWVMTPSW